MAKPARKPKATRFKVPDAHYTARAIEGRVTVEPADFDFGYTTPMRGKPCDLAKLDKGKCAMQLNFVKGKPVLVLCTERGKPGRAIPVSDATVARKSAMAACAAYKRTGKFPKSFKKYVDDTAEYDENTEVRGLSGRANERMLTLSLAGPRKRQTTRKTMAAKKRKKASKLKYCVYKVTKAGRRKVSCHKLKRTAKAAAKRKGKGNRVIKVR